MKADEFLIHLGHSKTGSTTLQQTLSRSRAALKQNGVLFPDLYPHAGNGLMLGYHLLDDDTDDAIRANWIKMTYAQAQHLSQTEWQKVLDATANEQPQKLLLSSEIFFGLIREGAVERFDQLTNNIAETKTAIVYLRAPHDFFLSAFQQSLKKVRLGKRVSRTRISNKIELLSKFWSGNISLNIFDRSTLINGDIVSDFVTKHLPTVDQETFSRPAQASNTSLSAEAISLLYDCAEGRLNPKIPPQQLINQIMKFDRRIAEPTKPRLFSDAADALINWSAPDLFWLRDEKGIVFPNIDYDTIKMDENALEPVSFERVEQFCEVNSDRKSALYARAERRAKLPPVVQRWLAKW